MNGMTGAKKQIMCWECGQSLSVDDLQDDDWLIAVNHGSCLTCFVKHGWGPKCTCTPVRARRDPR